MDKSKRYEVNRRIIGKILFCITHGGFYGLVEDVSGDECKLRVGDYVRYASIFDVRDPEYFV